MEDSCLDGKCTPVNHGMSACHTVDEGKGLQVTDGGYSLGQPERIRRCSSLCVWRGITVKD
jgi:hypothetical protein